MAMSQVGPKGRGLTTELVEMDPCTVERPDARPGAAPNRGQLWLGMVIQWSSNGHNWVQPELKAVLFFGTEHGTKITGSFIQQVELKTTSNYIELLKNYQRDRYRPHMTGT